MKDICLTDENTKQFQRSRNVGRNAIYGLLNRCISLLLPFIVRTVLIYRFGALYLGMNSLLSSIFQVLNLAELGFGTAVVYSLYKPVAEGDTGTVCAYLGTYRKIYRVIGLVIFVAGLAVMPFFPYLLKGTVVPGDMNLYAWYLIFLADTVVSYLLYGYKTAIPSALQRNDLLSKIDVEVLICKFIVQLGCLLLSDNFYYYLLTSLLFTVMRNLLVSHLVEQRYPRYVCRGSITQEQLAELKLLVGGLALSNFRGASRHMIDNICIAAFISLTMTAIYSNYFLIHSAVLSFSGILGGAMIASVGNSIATESRDKNYRDMRRFNFIFMLLAGWVAICLLCLYQPFVRLWVGSELMLGLPEVVALCLYFYVLEMGVMRWIYHQSAGLWWKARHIVIAEILCNIVLNILLAKYWGVLGIIVATLISLFFINFIGGAWILFKEYFQNGKLGEFFLDQGLYFGVTCVLAVLCFYGCDSISAWFSEVAGIALGSAVNGAAWGGMESAVNGAKVAVVADADGAVGALAGAGQAKLVGLADLVIRSVLCTVVTIAGYFLAYHRSVRYKDAKEWVQLRYRAMKK